VIVTGSCGRIGSSVVRRLGQQHRIVGFELLEAIYASNQEELVPVDLSSDQSVRQAFDHIRNFYGTKISSVIHLAAYYSFSEQHSEKYDTITVQGTERLLKALEGFEVEQFIFTSTMLVHKPTTPGHPITEDSPVEAKWDYPLSKVKTEAVIRQYCTKIPYVILRVAGVYDDRCHSIPISHQIQRIYEKQLEAYLFSGDTSHGSAFVHMDDLIDAIALAVEKRGQLPHETVLLIGEEKTLSYQELQNKISQLLFGKSIPTFPVPKPIAKLGAWILCHLPFGPPPFIRPWMIDLADDHYELDISRARKLLGWNPRHSLDATLPIMIQDLKRDPVAFYRFNKLNMPKKLAEKP
jgi:nucleoside-diphosphate-sugar epimerase